MISIVIPVYNNAEYLPEALYSALSQEVEKEIIIVDDGSEDGSVPAAVAGLGSDSRRLVRVIRHDSRMGAAISRMDGVRTAVGEYIAFLDADDMWNRDKLAKQVRKLKKTGAPICCTARQYMGKDGDTRNKTVHVPGRITLSSMLKTNLITCSSVLVKKSSILAHPMSHDEAQEDYLAWLRIIEAEGPAAGIDEPLTYYRVVKGSKSHSKLKSAAMTLRTYRLFGLKGLTIAKSFAAYALNGVIKHI